MDDRTTRSAMTRREALRLALTAAAGVPLAALCSRWAWAGPEEGARRAAGPATRSGSRGALPGRAQAVIEVWLSGGPSHLDTFDPKPEAGSDFRGPLDGAVATPVDGMRIGSLLPLLGAEARRFSLLRGMTHGQNGHETAAYVVQTGRDGGDRLVHPSVGAVVSLFKGWDAGYRGLVPPWVVLTSPLGRFSESGYLGPRHRPFVTGGDPNQARFAVEGVVAAGISDQRQADRRELLDALDTLGRAMPRNARFQQFDGAGTRAWDLVLGDARRVFDLSLEDAALRDRYGRTTFGQSCLMARRLVENGVPYVTVHSGGWDTHKQHFEAMRRKLPDLDRGLATLLGDLADRGLLDSTVVWCGGEFGRTPRVQWEPPWNGGRGHHGRSFSALVAGGGFRGGHVVGATDARGEDVAERPVHPREVHAALYEELGIDPDGAMPNGSGLDVTVAAPEPGGRTRRPLAEIR